jgi:hypothetical protein
MTDFKDMPKIMALFREAFMRRDPTVVFAATVFSDMMKRIFTDSKTTTGQTFGHYKKRTLKDGRQTRSSYMKRRLDAGLQVSYKDLIFTGNLQKSIKWEGTKGNQKIKDSPNAIYETLLGYIDDKHSLIAEGQEGQIGRGDIFTTTDAEDQRATDAAFAWWENEVDKIINSIFK